MDCFSYVYHRCLLYTSDGRIALTPAVELSYLTEQEQHLLLNEIEYADATPSLSQAQRLRDFSRQGRLNSDVIFAVMSEEKANQKEQIRFPKEEIQKYFPKSYTVTGQPPISPKGQTLSLIHILPYSRSRTSIPLICKRLCGFCRDTNSAGFSSLRLFK